MIMKLEITEPIFKCTEDKNIFIARLSEIVGFVKVVSCENVGGRGFNLYLDVNISDETVLKEVREICDLWHVSYKVLQN